MYSANEESLKVTKKNSNSDLLIVQASDTNKIKIRRKGKVGRNAWVGGAIGAGVGVTLALITAC